MSAKRRQDRGAVALDDAPPIATDIVADALALAGERKRAETEEADETRRHNLRVYCQLLARAEEPKPEDVRDLADVIDGLGLSAEQVSRDRAVIAEYRRWLAWNGRREDLEAARLKANKHRDEVRRRAHQETHDAMFAADRAQADLSDALAARSQMASIARGAPHLADGGLFELLAAG